MILTEPLLMQGDCLELIELKKQGDRGMTTL